MAKTDQDQHLKFSPQRYISFLKAFFDKKHSRIPQVNNIHGKNYLSPPGTHFFFSDPPMERVSKFGTESCRLQQKGGG